VKPLAIRGVKALGREALSTEAQILADIGAKQLESKVTEILTDRLAESAQRLVTKLKVGGQKRKLKITTPSST
jgi:hypothetical protein